MNLGVSLINYSRLCAFNVIHGVDRTDVLVFSDRAFIRTILVRG